MEDLDRDMEEMGIEEREIWKRRKKGERVKKKKGGGNEGRGEVKGMEDGRRKIDKMKRGKWREEGR